MSDLQGGFPSGAGPKIGVALVGVGKIARDQHLPSIARSPVFELGAAISRNAELDGVPNFPDLESFLDAGIGVPVVALCTPPSVRYGLARAALEQGYHVLLEKPPGATLGEVAALSALAEARGVTLFATWHSRFAPAVEPARAWLRGKEITSARIVWKEDVRRWHPGQAWIWQPGGFGVFDPGINAFSILTRILPDEVLVTEASLTFPENAHTPIAAEVGFASTAGYGISAELDWRQEGPQTWEIAVETTAGRLHLTEGGAALSIDGQALPHGPEAEYDGIYLRLAELLTTGRSDVDARPLRLVADALLCGRREVTEAFYD